LASITHEPFVAFEGKLTTPSGDSEQPLLLGSSVIETASPDVAVAVGVYDASPAFTTVGFVVLNSIVCWVEIVMVCCTCAAGDHVPLPSWLASMTHVPPEAKVTAPSEDSVQPLLLESSVIDTASPDVAVAVGVYAGCSGSRGPDWSR